MKGLEPSTFCMATDPDLTGLRYDELESGRKQEISILLASEDATITHARYSPGEQVATPHVHPRAHGCLLRPRGRTDLRNGARAPDDDGLLRRIRGYAAGGSPLASQRQRPRRALAHCPRARRGLRCVHARPPATASRSSWISPQCPPTAGLPASEAIVRSCDIESKPVFNPINADDPRLPQRSGMFPGDRALR